jgi:hypothetical protein
MSSCAVYELRINQIQEGVVVNFCDVIKSFKSLAKKWIFQLEEGESAGLKHFQCFISLIKKCLPTCVLKLFAKNTFRVNHIRPVHNCKELEQYVMKEQTRVDGPWCDTDEEVYIPVQYRDITLYSYQRAIYDNKLYNHRTINVIHDKIGCNGKSTVAALCAIQKGYIYLPAVRSYEDLIAAVFSKCYKKTRTPGVILVDLPRGISKQGLDELFAGLETIKGVYLYDKRYTFKEWWIDSPTIYVFSNKLPDFDLLSRDRWSIYALDHTGDDITMRDKTARVIR